MPSFNAAKFIHHARVIHNLWILERLVRPGLSLGDAEWKVERMTKVFEQAAAKARAREAKLAAK